MMMMTELVKLQRIIGKERKGLGEHDNEEHSLLHSRNTNRNIFKKSAGQCIDSDDDDPFFSRTKTYGGGVKSMKGI